MSDTYIATHTPRAADAPMYAAHAEARRKWSAAWDRYISLYDRRGLRDSAEVERARVAADEAYAAMEALSEQIDAWCRENAHSEVVALDSNDLDDELNRRRDNRYDR